MLMDGVLFLFGWIQNCTSIIWFDDLHCSRTIPFLSLHGGRGILDWNPILWMLPVALSSDWTSSVWPAAIDHLDSKSERVCNQCTTPSPVGTPGAGLQHHRQAPDGYHQCNLEIDDYRSLLLITWWTGAVPDAESQHLYAINQNK